MYKPVSTVFRCWYGMIRTRRSHHAPLLFIIVTGQHTASSCTRMLMDSGQVLYFEVFLLWWHIKAIMDCVFVYIKMIFEMFLIIALC